MIDGGDSADDDDDVNKNYEVCHLWLTVWQPYFISSVSNCDRSETCRSREALHNEHLARSMIEAALHSNADMISQLSSRLQKADDHLISERQMITLLANKLRHTEQVALQSSQESTNQSDILNSRYTEVLTFCMLSVTQCKGHSLCVLWQRVYCLHTLECLERFLIYRSNLCRQSC